MRKIFTKLKNNLKQFDFELESSSSNYTIKLTPKKDMIVDDESIKIFKDFFKILEDEGVLNISDVMIQFGKKISRSKWATTPWKCQSFNSESDLKKIIGEKIHLVEIFVELADLEYHETNNHKRNIDYIQNFLDNNTDLLYNIELNVKKDIKIGNTSCLVERILHNDQNFWIVEYDSKLILVTEIENKLTAVSSIRYTLSAESFYVVSVYTLPGYRRKGFSFILHKYIQDKTGLKYNTRLSLTKSGLGHMLSNRKKLISENMKHIKSFKNF